MDLSEGIGGRPIEDKGLGETAKVQGSLSNGVALKTAERRPLPRFRSGKCHFSTNFWLFRLETLLVKLWRLWEEGSGFLCSVLVKFW
jgi:hypothetical protein